MVYEKVGGKMSDMVYDMCKRHLDPERIWMYKDFSLERIYGRIRSERIKLGEMSYDFKINTAFSFDEQVHTLMHEVLHLHPRFSWILNFRQVEESWEDSDEIDDFARNILRERLDIVDYLKDTLEEAYVWRAQLPF